jgi:hypothetical protein
MTARLAVPNQPPPNPLPSDAANVHKIIVRKLRTHEQRTLSEYRIARVIEMEIKKAYFTKFWPLLF